LAVIWPGRVLLLHGSQAGADGVPVASQAVDALIEPFGFALRSGVRDSP
jgi:hypothetical protein